MTSKLFIHNKTSNNTSLYTTTEWDDREKNRTILDMTSLLKAKKLPKQYRAEAVSCAVYLLNHCPTRSLQAVTPEEAWSGHKPGVTRLWLCGICKDPICIEQNSMIKTRNVSLWDMVIEG